MTHVSPWERLPDTRRRVMAETGCSQLEAETDICRALADGVVNFRGKLKKHATSHMRAGDSVLEQSAFQIPSKIDRDELDWEQSRPRKPWIVKRGHFQPLGYWELEWILLSKADVTRALCTAGEDGPSTRRDELHAADAERVALDSTQTSTALAPRSTKGTRSSPGSARRRGPRPTKLFRVREAMRNDIRQGLLSAADLGAMLEKTLAANYGVSRDTARKARRVILQEFGEH